MNRLLVIADDFTGALDTGVQFSKKGVPTLVLTAEQFAEMKEFAEMKTEAQDGDYSVLVVDTESRHLTAAAARAAVAEVAARAIGLGFRRFYKKTDSALRGNIGAELAGLIDAWSGASALDACLTFVPAFPKNRRVTRNGVHYIDGVEAARSVFADDPFTPVLHSAVADVIHLQTDIPVENITSAEYEKAALKPERKAIRVLDAESADDIAAIGACLKRGLTFKNSDCLELLAGCAGFAEILPELLDLPARDMTLDRKADGVLVVSGSVNPVTMEQIAFGESIGFTVFTLSDAQKLDPSYPDSDECEMFARDVAGELARGGRVIVCAAREAAEPGISSKPDKNLSKLVADNIGRITIRLLDRAGRSSLGKLSLAVFGGDTLHAVLAHMGCKGVVPTAEISTGVAASIIFSDFSKYPAARGCAVITKSGGLGERDVLRKIEEFVFGTEG